MNGRPRVHGRAACSRSPRPRPWARACGLRCVGREGPRAPPEVRGRPPRRRATGGRCCGHAGRGAAGPRGGRTSVTALVLCGGGSRGAVEVGLYRALVELRIPIDLIVGTSVGAINGAAIAAGLSPDPLAQLWRGLTRRDVVRFNRQLFWKFLWADSLFDHRPLRRFLERNLPLRRFEELRIPLIVTGTDFGTGRSVYWRRGDLVDAIMASVAMPGLFPPQFVGGVQLVDGGITDNVPIGVAVAEGADTVFVMLCACCERVSGPVRALFAILRRALAIAVDRKYHVEVERYAGS